MKYEQEKPLMIHSRPVEFGRLKRWQEVAAAGVLSVAGVTALGAGAIHKLREGTQAIEMQRANDKQEYIADWTTKHNALMACEKENEELNGPEALTYFKDHFVSAPKVTMVPDKQYPDIKINNRNYMLYSRLDNTVGILTDIHEIGKPTSIYPIYASKGLVTDYTKPEGQYTVTLKFPPEDFTPPHALSPECDQFPHLPETVTIRNEKDVNLVAGFLEKLKIANEKIQTQGVEIDLPTGGIASAK